MNLTEIAIKNKVLILFICFVSIIASLFSYKYLGKLEDPPFTIKVAKVITNYQGASAEQVEEEVTEVLEESISELGTIYSLTSKSEGGRSIITVEMDSKYDGEDLRQIWDELRRKIRDVEYKLPSGAYPTLVIDDFGDVFGMLFAIKGDGLEYQDLTNTARDIQKHINSVEGVTRVISWGTQDKSIFIEFSQAELVSLGVSVQDIYKAIAAQSIVEDAGDVIVNGNNIVVLPSGKFQNIEDVGKIRITNSQTGANVALEDIAKIYTDVQDPLNEGLYIGGKPAVAVAISVSPDRNIIETGQDVEARLAEIQVHFPLGLELERIYWQPDSVSKAVNGFMANFIESFLIVFAVLFVSMGVRNSLLVTVSLLLNICITFVLMYIFNISMHRVSLGALIISLGMLVDNAIVVVQGVTYGREKGLSFLESIKRIVQQSAMPLLGATLIAVLAFSPVGLSQEAAGEINFSLFQVILISLLSSWLIAIFVLPVIGRWFFRKNIQLKDSNIDKESIHYVLSNSLFLRVYDKVLKFVLRNKIAFLLICLGMLFHAIQLQKVISKQFFPDSNLEMFTVDLWYPKGIDIAENSKKTNEIAKYVEELDNVAQVTAWVGGSPPRFLLALYTEDDSSSYSTLVIKTNNLESMGKVSDSTLEFIDTNYPDILSRATLMSFGPKSDSSVEVRFYGKDSLVLENLANQAKDIMYNNPGLKNVRTGWRNSIKSIKPIYDEEKAKKVFVSYEDLAKALKYNFNGLTLGYINQGYNVVPIVSRPVKDEYDDIKKFDGIYVQSSQTGKYIPIENVISGTNFVLEKSIVLREDRVPYISVLSQHSYGTSLDRFHEIRKDVEAIELPPGYDMKWYGDYENSSRANDSLKEGLAPSIIAITILVLLLFNSIRQLIIIYLSVVFMLIGVFYGLYISNNPLNFVAVLAIISLVGIFIKNAIVLIDEFNIQLKKCNGNIYNATRAASVLRVKPVALTAITTILGMIPLTGDMFFKAMAYCMIFGLTFSVFLSSFLLPVMLSLFYGKHYKVKG